ncbi:MAG: rod shape-determining protein MreC [Treponema sp.]|nr:rod shape-determining protein MreC [Treponema sp.]
MKNRNKFKISIRLPEIFFVVYLVAAAVMMSFNAGGFVLNFKQIGFTICSTVEKGIAAVTGYVTDTVGAIKKLTTLSREYDALLEKLADYEYMQRTNASIRKENERLKELLGFSESLVNKTIPANIISRGADNLHATIVVNKGSKDGVKKNMPVISVQHGTVGVVGKVVTVGYGTCQIMPIYDFNCSVSARVQNTRNLGLISGNGSEDVPLMLKHIKRKSIEELKYGELVVTSGENENYLKDIPIGTISKVSVVSYDNNLNIEIIPVIDFSKLENVIIVSMKDYKAEGEEKK